MNICLYKDVFIIYIFQASVFTALPSVFMGGVAGIASIIVLLLPETLNVKLPDTIEEAVNIRNIKKTDNKI